MNPFVAIEQLGRNIVKGIEEFGYAGSLLAETVFWIFAGPFKKQPVKFSSIFYQMMQVGIAAIPIVVILTFAIGIMLAIQGIHTLKVFGAETQVVLGIALSVVREFGPLITGILVAGRTGSALAARVGTMQVSQEIDALRVMGVNPVRYLASPVLIAMVVMLPALTFLSMVAGLFGGAIFCVAELGMSFSAYADSCYSILERWDLIQGLIKSVVFAVIITMVGLTNGFSVTGGAEGVGRSTTRSVVLSISFIVMADMIFTYFMNR